MFSVTSSWTQEVTEFDRGEVTFDFNNETVTIINQSDQRELGFPEGVYTYSLSIQDNDQSLLIGEGFLYGSFELFTTWFTIDQRHFDGPLYTFRRN